MKILNLIQVKRKESLIKRLVKVEIFLNKETFSKYENIETDKLAYASLSGELFKKSSLKFEASNLWMTFMLPFLYSYNLFGFNNDYGKQLLEDVLNKTKEEYKQESNKDI